MSLFSFCKRAREAFRRPAIEDVYPTCLDDDDDSLTDGLSLSYASAHESWIERTCVALRGNTVEELEVDQYDNVVEDDDLLLISNALKDSTGVTCLVLRNIETEIDKNPLLVAPILREGRSIRSIRLEDSGEEAVISIAGELAQESRNVTALHLRGNVICPKGAEAIGDMLKCSRSLEQFGFCHNGITGEGLGSIAQGLRQNQSLKTLDLLGNAITDVPLSKLCNSLTYNQSLEFLCLDFNDFAHHGIQSIASMLKSNSTLKELHLFGNRIDGPGAECLASALSCNSSLKKLVLSFNRIGNEGAAALAKVLTINSTLSKLTMPSNQIGTDGMRTWGGLLPKMKGLEYLDVGDVFDTVAAESLVKGLEGNTRLTILHMESPAFDESCITESRLDFLLRFNRCGRSLLHSRGDVPPRLWATALAKASDNRSPLGCPDVMYSILREIPDLFEFRR
jgi:Ran GTPase-activating protein (RanGAP) involved in mRNA processing and transport